MRYGKEYNSDRNLILLIEENRLNIKAGSKFGRKKIAGEK